MMVCQEKTEIMRIAQLVETLDAGGAEVLAVGIANALARNGHESHLVVLRGGGRLQDRIDSAVTYLNLGTRPSMGSAPARLWDFRSTYQVVAGAMRDSGIEVIQSHLPRANHFNLFLGRNRVARTYPTVHNNREFDYGDNASALRQTARKRAYRQMLAWCTRMIAVSDKVRAGMIGELNIGSALLADRIVAVPNGVAIPPETSQFERETCRQALNIELDTLLIVAVGRLSRQKNFRCLVAALATLPESMVPWKCVIAGEGELRTELETQIAGAGLQDKVVLAGHVADVRSLLAAADVFCLSSLFEGLPLVMLEAMAGRLPVCAPRIDGVVDVVTDGVNALLANSDDPAGLATNLQRLLGDQKLRRQLGMAGYDLIAGGYSFDVMIERLEAVYAMR